MVYASSLWSVVALALPLLAVPVAEPTTEYDFIIVGGGTAGLALATRLSQRLPNDSILVIESGPSALDEPRINVPARKGSTLGTIYDWNYTTVPQAAANNRVLTVNRGKVLGGSSALNLMVWDRASDTEYDAWEQLGNPSWNWKTMIKYMLKVENFTGAGTSDYGHKGVGFHGPVQTVIDRNKPTHISYFIPTVNANGIGTNLESLGGNPLGVMYQPLNIDPTRYVRSYSANAYLPLGGPGLTVLDNTSVDVVTFGSNAKALVATGVRLVSGTVITAKKEVILSGGTVATPGLLERSGIGQSAVLEALNIAVKKELAGVGENLQDHTRVSIAYQLKDNYTSLDLLRFNGSFTDQQAQLYYDGRFSLYDSAASGFIFANWNMTFGDAETKRLNGLAEQVANKSDPLDRIKLDWLAQAETNRVPQSEIIASDGYAGFRGYPAANSSLYGKSFFTLYGGMMHSFSRGSIHINSTSPTVKPLIDFRYISNDYEVDALMDLIKYNRKLARTYPLSQAWVTEYEPGFDVQTDDQIREYVRASVLSIYHPVGTAAMKPECDGGVVDPELLVYGTRNLRVVDASIYPILPAAHPQTGIYAVAERAADFITDRWHGKG